jgi:N-acetylmuramic acid 6-phosphate (MurNAc-6-P) etherase
MSSILSTIRVSEAPNPLTTDIDVAETPGLVRILAASDSMLFSGFAGIPNIYSDEIVAKCARIASAVAAALKHPEGKVVFSGCGTSGRLAHLTARSLNMWMRRSYGIAGNRFDYLLAGTDAALLLPQEQIEDKPTIGRADLEEWIRTNKIQSDTPVVVIGISCGLSATYVASMLQASLEHPSFTSVAMGFNPVEAVKNVRVDGWEYTFYMVLQDMLGKYADRAVVLNPAAGPETIAGSSRKHAYAVSIHPYCHHSHSHFLQA